MGSQGVPLIVLRVLFVVVAIGTGVSTAIELRNRALGTSAIPPYVPYLATTVVLLAAAATLVMDWVFPRKRIETVSAVYFGTLTGLILAYALRLALSPIIEIAARDYFSIVINSTLAICLCYLCISLLIQTKDDFRFVIPYVEFSKEVKGSKPYVLDTSVIIDGRISDLAETGLFDNQIIIPRFAIGELQGIADSSDRMRRSRGRRGLDVLNQLQGDAQVDLMIDDRDLPEFSGQPVDIKLVLLAKHVGGKIVTNDYNLNKVAKLHGVGVVNLNDLANALKPVLLPGETTEVRIVKPGEEAGQGIGYLEDGTMIVVEGGRDHQGQNVQITVTSMLQTSAGRMIFGRFEARKS